MIAPPADQTLMTRLSPDCQAWPPLHRAQPKLVHQPGDADPALHRRSRRDRDRKQAEGKDRSGCSGEEQPDHHSGRQGDSGDDALVREIIHLRGCGFHDATRALNDAGYLVRDGPTPLGERVRGLVEMLLDAIARTLSLIHISEPT